MANKDVAWSFFEHLSNGRIDEAHSLLIDEGTWWLSSQRRAVPMSKTKPAAHKIFEIVPMKFTLHRAIEEGDHVALEVESHATLADGSVYNNVYCYVMTISGGKILHVREHADTKYAAEALPPSAWAAEDTTWD